MKSTDLRRMKRVRRTLNTNIPVFSLGAKQDACFKIYLLKIKEGENAGRPWALPTGGRISKESGPRTMVGHIVAKHASGACDIITHL